MATSLGIRRQAGAAAVSYEYKKSNDNIINQLIKTNKHINTHTHTHAPHKTKKKIKKTNKHRWARRDGGRDESGGTTRRTGEW